MTDRWISQLIELTDQLKDVGVTVGKPALEGGGVTSTVEPRKVPLVEETEETAAEAPSAPSAVEESQE